MKKLFFIVLISVCAFMLFAFQETYREDSQEVKTFRMLKRMTGDNSVEPTYPISGSQLAILYKSLDVSNLNADAKTIYQDVLNSLDNRFSNTFWHNDSTAFDIRANLNPQVYLRTSDETITYERLYDGLPNKESLFVLGGSMWLGNKFAGYWDYELNRREYGPNLFNKKFSANFPHTDQEEKSPFEAWVSFGDSYYNFTLGRDNLSAGNGRFKNLFISDNFLWNDFAKFSAITDFMSYDFTIMNFRRESNWELASTDFNSPSAMIANHRFSVSLWNYLTVSVYEGMLEYGDNMLQSLELLNPFMVLHNTGSFSPGNNNNNFGVEFTVNLSKGFEFGLQVMFDQIQGSDEVNDDLEGVPDNAYAGLLNLSWSGMVNKGLMDAFIEAVYVSPVCYLKENNPRGSSYQPWQTDWLLGNALDCIDYFQWLGYPFGPDTISVVLGTSYKKDKLSASADLTYTLAGTYGMKDVLVGGIKYFGSVTPFCLEEGTVPEHNIIAGIKAKYQLLPQISFSGSLAYLKSINYENIKGQSFTDIQCSIGTKIQLAPFAKQLYEAIF